VRLTPTSPFLINDALGFSDAVANRLLWISVGFSPDKMFEVNLTINLSFDVSFGGPPISGLAGTWNYGTTLVFNCSTPACNVCISAASKPVFNELEYHIDALQVVEHETSGE
jgi:hypothetical protein